MTHHEPILISEIRYLDHISWPRFWLSALIWPVTLSVAITVTTFWIAEANGWTPLVFISVVSTSVFSAYFSISMLLARFYRYRISLNPSEISIHGWLWTSTFPIDGLQMRQGVLNEDRNFSWAHSKPCSLIYVDRPRTPLKYAVEIVPQTHFAEQISSRRPVAIKAIAAAIFCIIVFWMMAVLGYSWLGLTTQDRASFSYVWAMTTAPLFLGYYIGRLSWYAWLKDAGLLEPRDLLSTGKPFSEFFQNLLAVALIMGALPDGTFTGPMALLLLIVYPVIDVHCAHIVRSDIDRIKKLIAFRQQYAKNVLLGLLSK
ncbi:hypothetical protein [Lacunimicrobium album]